jgi:preprotein translocase subunit SecE
MASSEKSIETSKDNFFTGVKTEVKKIIWPTKQATAKETTAVIVISVVVGLMIALMDFIIQYGIDFLVKL